MFLILFRIGQHEEEIIYNYANRDPLKIESIKQPEKLKKNNNLSLKYIKPFLTTAGDLIKRTCVR